MSVIFKQFKNPSAAAEKLDCGQFLLRESSYLGAITLTLKTHSDEVRHYRYVYCEQSKPGTAYQDIYGNLISKDLEYYWKCVIDGDEAKRLLDTDNNQTEKFTSVMNNVHAYQQLIDSIKDKIYGLSMLVPIEHQYSTVYHAYNDPVMNSPSPDKAC